MSNTPSFDRLLRDVSRGDSDRVADQIVRRYAARLVALAARRTSERLRRRVEAEDIVQSVSRTFFRRLDGGELVIQDWESLWGLLARIAVCRVCRHAKHNRAACRDQGREEDGTSDLQAFDREPTAEEVLLAEDLHANLIEAMPEKYRPIVERILEGWTHEEIAHQLGTSISSVERVHKRARERLSEMLTAE